MAPIQPPSETTSPRRRAAQPTLEAVHVAGTDVQLPSPPLASELSNWERRTWDMDAAAAAQLGFAVGSGKFSGRRHVLISEFSRSKTVSENGKRVRYGVAVRLLVEVTHFEASAGLNLPLVAAQAQMGTTTASSQLRVEGYVGKDLAALIPREHQFNVESYVTLMRAVADIQKLVSSKEANIRPAPLELPDISTDSREERAAAFGIIWALSNIADGRSCWDALSRLPNSSLRDSDAVVEAIKATYADAGGDAASSDSRPSESHRREAREFLGAVRLRA